MSNKTRLDYNLYDVYLHYLGLLAYSFVILFVWERLSAILSGLHMWCYRILKSFIFLCQYIVKIMILWQKILKFFWNISHTFLLSFFMHHFRFSFEYNICYDVECKACIRYVSIYYCILSWMMNSNILL
jgi:hypothetical protein